MKIIIPLSQLEQLILDDLYFLTYKGKDIKPITEKRLRKEMERKSPLHNTLKRLIDKGYVMRALKNGKYYYAMSPNGKKIYDLIGIIGELDFEKSQRGKKRYATMCCKCFSIRYVKEEKKFANDNLCIECELKQKD